MKKNIFNCSDIISSEDRKCDQIIPTIKKILIRRCKDGKYELKINDNPVWLQCEFDEEKRTVRYYL